jgi:hypothetical protein
LYLLLVEGNVPFGLELPVNHKRVARLMRQAALQNLYQGRYRHDPMGPATEDDRIMTPEQFSTLRVVQQHITHANSS